ncbi:MAG: hypothetical protein F9B45_03200 [Phycisphaera sp. RhM]|nr:hypothetical protein [Phycisphaera sp. RhM]
MRRRLPPPLRPPTNAPTRPTGASTAESKTPARNRDSATHNVRPAVAKPGRGIPFHKHRSQTVPATKA